MSKSIELSREESLEIADMMNSLKDPQEGQDSEDAFKSAFLQLKKVLKRRSKQELIVIVWTYANELTQLQYVAQQLLEENKKLKGEKSE